MSTPTRIPTRAAVGSVATLIVAALVSVLGAAPAATQPAPPPPARPTIAFYGDSTALVTGIGLSGWLGSDGPMIPVSGDTGLGCGLTRVGVIRYGESLRPADGDCGQWTDRWPALATVVHPDIAVIEVGPFDVADHLFPGESTWRAPGDPVYDATMHQELLGAVDVFLSRGIHTVVLTSPDINDKTQSAGPVPESDPRRMAVLNATIWQVASERPALRVVDLARWLQTGWPGGEFDPELRPDGIHFTIFSAAADVAPWLAPAILHATGLARPSPRIGPNPARSGDRGRRGPLVG